MKEFSHWFKDIKAEDFWNDENPDIRLTIRVIVCLSGLSFFVYLVAMVVAAITSAISLGYAGMGYPLGIGAGSLVLGLAMNAFIILAVRNRHLLGFIGLIMMAGGMMTGLFFPLGIFTAWWMLRPEIRGEFKLDVQQTSSKDSQAVILDVV